MIIKLTQIARYVYVTKGSGSTPKNIRLVLKAAKISHKSGSKGCKETSGKQACLQRSALVVAANKSAEGSRQSQKTLTTLSTRRPGADESEQTEKSSVTRQD